MLAHLFIRCCMSFGFSLKNSKSAIGQYGNGFKTSSMRLGADVIVFSRHMKKRKLTQSIGLLSYTFLRQTGHDRIVVPMVDYEFESSSGIFRPLLRYKEEHFTSNLSILLRWSPFATEAELLKQFDDMGSHGTKVVIYNLWFNDEGDTELDLDSDTQDIRISGNPRTAHTTSHSKTLSEQHIANRYHYSLRVYMSILYLRIPQSFRMVLRGKVVEHHNIADDLKFPEFILYRPQIGGNMEAVAVTTIGFLKDAPHVNIRGFNVYHRNRLILPFWCVVKNQSNSRGRGVVGVLEANFIEPTHDKQDFEKTTTFQRLEARLKDMTMEYWDFHCGLIGYHQVKKVPQIQVPSQKTSETGTYSGIQIKNHCSGDTRNLRSASTDRGFQDSLSSPSHSSGGSGQHVNKIHTNSLRGLPFKRKDNAVILEPESMKRHAGVRVDVTDAEQNGEEKCLIGVGNQLLDKQAIIMMNQNKKLHAQLLVHEKTVEGLNLKVRSVRKELEEIQSEYAKMLAESESIDATKEERM